MKGNKGKGIDLDKTIPLWSENTEKTMKKLEEPYLCQQDKNIPQNWLAVSSKHENWQGD